jgi:hypothetical protein
MRFNLFDVVQLCNHKFSWLQCPFQHRQCHRKNWQILEGNRIFQLSVLSVIWPLLGEFGSMGEKRNSPSFPIFHHRKGLPEIKIGHYTLPS